MISIIEPKARQDRYSIRARATILGITLAALCAEANRRTGYNTHPSDFSKAVAGKIDRPSTDKTLEVADQILREYEKGR